MWDERVERSLWNRTNQMTIPSLTSVLATIYTPPKRDGGLLTTRNLALGGVAATSIAAGGIIGKLRGNPLAGLGIGAAIAAVAVGAALIGNASDSYYGDYPSGGSGGGRHYPSGGSGGHTSPGDDGGGYTPPSGGSGGSHGSGDSTDNGNPSDSDF
jgi:hypothetical protein